MKQLTINDVNSVNGGNTDLLIALMPVAGVALKGLLMSYELGLKPTSVIPVVAVVGLFSGVGAAFGYAIYNKPALGSAVGGGLGMLSAMYFKLDTLA